MNLSDAFHNCHDFYPNIINNNINNDERQLIANLDMEDYDVNQSLIQEK